LTTDLVLPEQEINPLISLCKSLHIKESTIGGGKLIVNGGIGAPLRNVIRA
jgi:hypothetical protein